MKSVPYNVVLDVSLGYKKDSIKHQYLLHVNFIYDANHVLMNGYDVHIHLSLI